MHLRTAWSASDSKPPRVDHAGAIRASCAVRDDPLATPSGYYLPWSGGDRAYPTAAALRGCHGVQSDFLGCPSSVWGLGTSSSGTCGARGGAPDLAPRDSLVREYARSAVDAAWCPAWGAFALMGSAAEAAFCLESCADWHTHRWASSSSPNRTHGVDRPGGRPRKAREGRTARRAGESSLGSCAVLVAPLRAPISGAREKT